MSDQTTSRRQFLKAGTVASVGTLAALSASSVHAGGNDVIKVGIVGCGGRGTGAAAQALRADKNCKLVAMADAFADRLELSLQNLKGQKDLTEKLAVADDHKFVGFDCHEKLLESGVDVVLLCSPPHFRPAQMKAAVAKGVHVFCEKPVAVDAPGVRDVIEACKVAAEKKLSVVSGLCWRYHPAVVEAFKRMQDGQIGKILVMEASYNTGFLWNHGRKEQWSDMEYQMRNWLYYTWLSGDHIVEQHIHSLDKLGWAMGDQPPVAATGTGGRQVRTEPAFGHIYDHFAIQYEYADGVKGFSRCRQQGGCANDVSDHFWGTKGICHVKGDNTSIVGHDPKDNWQYPDGGRHDMYQLEHNALFASIRDSKPINNGEYMTRSTMLAILGRMAAYTGKRITWEEALNSKEKLGPEKYEWGQIAMPPVAMPGLTPFA